MENSEPLVTFKYPHDLLRRVGWKLAEKIGNCEVVRVFDPYIDAVFEERPHHFHFSAQRSFV